MLLHARDALGGTDGMAQVDLDVRHNHHQPLPALGPMAYAVLRVILERLREEGRLLDDHAPPLQTADGRLIQVELVERPPYATLRARERLSGAPLRLHGPRRHAAGQGASLFRDGGGRLHAARRRGRSRPATGPAPRW